MTRPGAMSRLKKWLKLIKKASPYRNVFFQIFDIIQTKIRVNLSPIEYYIFEFYKGGKTWEEKSRYIGKHGSLYWPYALNPLKFNVTLTNKYVQKNLLMGFGLPTPRLIATVGHKYEIQTLDDLHKFLSDCDRDIVVKPISGMGGLNVLILTHEDHRFHMLGEHYTPERIWRHMEPILEKGFLIEEKISNNRQISSIYPYSLNCFRVNTVKLNNIWKVIYPFSLKVGCGKNVVDNLRSGGILLILDKEGRSKIAYVGSPNEVITHHPDSGAPLIGIQLDNTKAVCELALQASQKFGYMGTIGWDIALTEKGPVVIEGNNQWGAESQALLGGRVTDEMAQILEKHPFFSRWDRRYAFPRFNARMKAFKK